MRVRAPCGLNKSRAFFPGSKSVGPIIWRILVRLVVLWWCPKYAPNKRIKYMRARPCNHVMCVCVFVCVIVDRRGRAGATTTDGCADTHPGGTPSPEPMRLEDTRTCALCRTIRIMCVRRDQFNGITIKAPPCAHPDKNAPAPQWVGIVNVSPMCAGHAARPVLITLFAFVCRSSRFRRCTPTGCLARVFGLWTGVLRPATTTTRNDVVWSNSRLDNIA